MTAHPHIIVVDDELAAREMVGDYLKMHGFEVTLCDGGGSLRRAMQDVTPDLVVLDLNMPEEDGLSIVRDINRRATCRSSCLPPPRAPLIGSWGWSSAPTITCRSPASCANSWPASARFSAVARRPALR